MKQLNVLRIEQNTPFGLIAFCHAPEWDGLDYSEIQAWFADSTDLIFPDSASVPFSLLQPTGACFGGKKRHAILTLSMMPPVTVAAPLTAYVS